MLEFLTFVGCLLMLIALWRRSITGVGLLVCAAAFAHHEHGLQPPAQATRVFAPVVELHDDLRGRQQDRADQFVCGAVVTRATREEHQRSLDHAARRCPTAVRPTRSDTALSD